MFFCRLEELCNEIIDCPHSTPKWKNQGIPVIRNYNLNNVGIDLSKLSYVDEETYYKRIQRARPEAGDIIISREAPMGVVGMVPDNFKCCLGQRLVLLKVNKKKCNPLYLLYTLTSKFVQMQIQRINQTGSIVSNLNIPDLKNLIIPVIEKNQNKVSDLLNSITNKIDNNNKINYELEEMAKTIYDYWFFQFEFPNEEGKPYKSSGGKMIWNEELEREIPAGWKTIKLQDVFSFVKGKIPRITFDNSTAGAYPYITIDVANGGKCQYCFTDDMPVCNGEVIMVMDGAASGDIYIGNRGVLGSTFAMLKKKSEDISDALIYVILSSRKNVYKKVNTGSTVPHANKKFIENMRVPVTDNMSSFSRVFDEIYKKIELAKRENQELISLRDFLLPLLMNGQVRFEE